MADNESAHFEVWKQIPSIQTHEISNFGRVRRRIASRNWVAGKILSPSLDKKGYWRFTLEGQSRALHSLVCEAFNGIPEPGEMCRHLNDDKNDNRPSNLEWGTAKDNSADQRINGKMSRVIFRFDRDKAILLRNSGMTFRAIGAALGVSHVAVILALKTNGAPG